MPNNQRIKELWQELGNNKMKISFTLDIIKSYLFKGKKGLDSELETWEDTIEIMNDNSLMNKINEVRSRVANSRQ